MTRKSDAHKHTLAVLGLCSAPPTVRLAKTKVNQNELGRRESQTYMFTVTVEWITWMYIKAHGHSSSSK